MSFLAALQHEHGFWLNKSPTQTTRDAESSHSHHGRAVAGLVLLQQVSLAASKAPLNHCKGPSTHLETRSKAAAAAASWA